MMISRELCFYCLEKIKAPLSISGDPLHDAGRPLYIFLKLFHTGLTVYSTIIIVAMNVVVVLCIRWELGCLTKCQWQLIFLLAASVLVKEVQNLVRWVGLRMASYFGGLVQSPEAFFLQPGASEATAPTLP
jgi:hypothetical protein